MPHQQQHNRRHPHQNRMMGLGPNPDPNKGLVGKHNRKGKLTRHSVLKMLAVMEASRNAGPSKTPDPQLPATPENQTSEDFIHSGRTGRRNALADIMGAHATVSSSDLPSKLEGLTTNDPTNSTEKDKAKTEEEPQPGSSKS